MTSLLILSASAAIRIDAKAKANLIEQVKAELLADGIAQLLAARVSATGLFLWGSINLQSGMPVACRFEEATVVVTITDVRDFVDLNSSPLRDIEALFQRLTGESDHSAKLAAAILDYRDRDSRASSGGAEISDYTPFGLLHGPKNRPFEAVAELEQVSGMTRELYEASAPFLSVHSPRSDQNSGVARVLGRKNSDRVSDLSSPDNLAAKSADGPFKLTSKAFDVRVAINSDSGAVIVRRSVIELQPRVALGYLVREWNAPQPSTKERNLLKRKPELNCFVKR